MNVRGVRVTTRGVLLDGITIVNLNPRRALHERKQFAGEHEWRYRVDRENLSHLVHGHVNAREASHCITSVCATHMWMGMWIVPVEGGHV